MRKICPQCGAVRDEYFYIYRPLSADEIIQGILEKIPGVNITTNSVAGNKIQLIFRKELNETQKKKLNNFLISKGFIEDPDAELHQRGE